MWEKYDKIVYLKVSIHSQNKKIADVVVLARKTLAIFFVLTIMSKIKAAEAVACFLLLRTPKLQILPPSVNFFLKLHNEFFIPLLK